MAFTGATKIPDTSDTHPPVVGEDGNPRNHYKEAGSHGYNTHVIEKNTCLAQDKESLVRLAQSLGKPKAWLTNQGADEDDVGNWRGIKVLDERVTEIDWNNHGLIGTIIPEIAALSALTSLKLNNNELTCVLPAEIGDLLALKTLMLAGNYFELFKGIVPPSFANLKVLENFSLRGVRGGYYPHTIFPPAPRSEENSLHRRSRVHWAPFVDIPFHELRGREEVQNYLAFMYRKSVLRFFRYGLKITELRARQGSLIEINPFLDLLCTHEGIHERVMSCLDPYFCLTSERKTLLELWRTLGGHDVGPHWRPKGETSLREGHGNDVYRWSGIDLKKGRVVGITWLAFDLKGRLPEKGLPEGVGRLPCLETVAVFSNEARNAKLLSLLIS